MHPLDRVGTNTHVGMEFQDIRTIVDFLQRPEALKSLTFSANQAKGKVLVKFQVPQDVLPQMKRDKIVGFKNFRADAVLDIKASSSPFISGKLLIAFYNKNKFNYGQVATGTSVNILDGFYDGDDVVSLTALTGCPHVILDLASGEPVNITIPYISHDSHWDVTTVAPTESSDASIPTTLELVICSYTELYVDSGFSLQLFVSLQNIDLSFPTYPTRELFAARDKFRQHLIDLGIDNPPQALLDKVRLDAYSYGFQLQSGVKPSDVISQVAPVVGASANYLGRWPRLQKATETISKLAAPISSILSMFGYSKEIHNSNPLAVEMQLNRYAQNFDGVDTSRVFALSHNNEIKSDEATVSTALDEMSFPYIFHRDEYISTFNWQTTDAAGAVLTRFLVNPLAIDLDYGEKAYNPALSANQSNPAGHSVVPTHLSFIGHMFTYWRGELIYTFRFAKTSFHVGRVRIMWLPGDQDANYDPSVTYATGNPEASYFYQKIVDLRDINEVEFRIPFAANRPFNVCERDSLVASQFPNYVTNGTIIVQALTTLSAPATVSTTVPCVVEIRAGEDFEYAYFRGNPWYIPTEVPVGIPNHTKHKQYLHDYAPSRLPWCAETYGGISEICSDVTGVTHVIVDNNPLNVEVINIDPLLVDIDNEPINVTVTNGSLPVDILNQPITVHLDDPPALDVNLPMLGVYALGTDPFETWTVYYDDKGNFPEHMEKPVTPGGSLIDGALQYKCLLTDSLDLANIWTHMDIPDEQAVAMNLTYSNSDTWGTLVRAADPGFLPVLTEPPLPIYPRKTQQTVSERKHPSGFVERFIRYFQFVYPYAKDAFAEDPELKQFELQANITVNNTGDMVSDSSKSDTISPAMYSMGESVFSIRSLMKMFTRTGFYSNFPTQIVDREARWRSNGITIYPQVVRPSVSITTCTNGAVAATESGINGNSVCFYHYPDLFDVMSLMYGFAKGSIRIKVANMLGGVASCNVSMRSSQTLNGSTDAFGDNPAFPMADPTESLAVTTGSDPLDQIYLNNTNFEFYIGNDVEARNIQLQLPFYKNLVMNRIDKDILWNDVNMYDENGFWRMPANAVSFVYDYSADGDSQMTRHQRLDVYRAIADDFSYHLLQGLPPIVCTDYSRNGGAPAINPTAFKHRFQI